MGVGAFGAYAFQPNAFQVSTDGTAGDATDAPVTVAVTADAPVTVAVALDEIATVITATVGLADGGGVVASVYDVGDVARLTVTFTQDGVALNPTAVTVTTLTPALVSTTYTYGGAEIVRTATGNYYLDIAVAAVGHYHWRWAATGVGASAVEGWFTVRAREVA